MLSGVLRAVDLGKTYSGPSGEVVALRGFTHEFQRGAITAVVGPSGSGKSTLLNLLAGFDTPSDGGVYLGEVAFHREPERRRAELRLRHFGFVFQSYNLLSVFSARQNIEFPMGLAGVPAAERRLRAEALLERFGVARRAEHLIHKLSGGERQRVALARALANDPDVVFADEPTGSLDRHSGREVVAALREVAAEGRSVVLVTHDEKLAASADALIRLEDGEMSAVEHPAPAEVAATARGTADGTAPLAAAGGALGGH